MKLEVKLLDARLREARRMLDAPQDTLFRLAGLLKREQHVMHGNRQQRQNRRLGLGLTGGARPRRAEGVGALARHIRGPVWVEAGGPSGSAAARASASVANSPRLLRPLTGLPTTRRM